MSSISAPKPVQTTNTFDLLVNRGWVSRVDWAFLAMTVVWPVIGHFVLHWSAVPMLLFNILILMMWLIMLAYRIAYFIIIVQVTMDSLPATSARLAVKFLKTGAANMTTGA